MDQHTPQVIFQVLMARMPEFLAAVSQEVSVALHQSRMAKMGYQQALQQASVVFVQSLCQPDLTEETAQQPVLFALPEDESDNIPIQNYLFSKRHFATNVQHYAADVERFYVEHYKHLGITNVKISVSPSGVVLTLVKA